LNVADFDFDLPRGCIAQAPEQRRDRSRLMVLERESGALEHRRFGELKQLLKPNDLLVLNDTRVIPARLLGRKTSGGRVELLLLEPSGDDERRRTWKALVHSSRTPAAGSTIEIDEGLRAELLRRDGDGWQIRLESDGEGIAAAIQRVGHVPLPPYIQREHGSPPGVDDRERYQTVYAKQPGSVAAPTAGLHFTRELLDDLGQHGVRTARVTLHIGLGTFQPVRGERVEEHRMHEEHFDLPAATAEAIERARRDGGRVVAVGTSVVRTLESLAEPDGRVAAGSGRSSLFIFPGHRFRAVDAMLTNFHLPRSTLLMLVSAFAGRERVLAAYREAIDRGYRFYSYGDAMLVESR